MHHRQHLVGAVSILVLSVNVSLQQTCSPTQFKCLSGECINNTYVCNYFRNCADNSDEENCTSSPVDKTKALVLLYADQTALFPVSLCNWFGDPAQYVPKIGNVNLTLPLNFAITRPASRVYDYISTIDVDSRNSLVLFGNNANQRIEWGAFKTDNFNTTHIPNLPAFRVAAIAYDWVATNVYWLEAAYRQIRVAFIGQPSRQFYTKTVVQNITNPRDIAVDPVNGFLFWISGACGTAQIMRSSLNGNNATPVTIAPTPTNNCPIKLAVDVNSRLLYWLDANNTRLGYVRYDGSSLTNSTTSPAFEAMSSITTFGDYVVLGSTTNQTVNFYTKDALTFAGSHDSPLPYPLVDVAAYDEPSQPTNGSNSPCKVSNGGCSQLCFTTSSSTSVCDCTSNYVLNSDGKSCNTITTETTTNTLTTRGTVSGAHNIHFHHKHTLTCTLFILFHVAMTQ